MNKDVVVIVKVDDKPKIAESLDIIIFATTKVAEPKNILMIWTASKQTGAKRA